MTDVILISLITCWILIKSLQKWISINCRIFLIFSFHWLWWWCEQLTGPNNGYWRSTEHQHSHRREMSSPPISWLYNVHTEHPTADCTVQPYWKYGTYHQQDYQHLKIYCQAESWSVQLSFNKFSSNINLQKNILTLKYHDHDNKKKQPFIIHMIQKLKWI